MIHHVCNGCDTVLFENAVPLRSRRRPSPRTRRAFLMPLTGVLVILASGIGLAAGAVAYGTWSVSRNYANEALTRTVEAKDGRSRIQVPESWTPEPMEFVEEGELKVGSWRGDVCVKVLTEAKVILGQEMRRDEYARVAIDALKRDLDGTATVIGPKAMTVNGRPALRYEVRGKVGGTSALFLVTIVEGECSFHQVVALTTSWDEESDRVLLERVTATFREGR